MDDRLAESLLASAADPGTLLCSPSSCGSLTADLVFAGRGEQFQATERFEL